MSSRGCKRVAGWRTLLSRVLSSGHSHQAASPSAPRLANSQQQRGVVTLLLLVVTVAGLDGCMFRALRQDIERLNTLAMIGGRVSISKPEDAPIVVVLSASNPLTAFDSFVLNQPGPYFFTVPQGTYRVAAFVDRNRDLAYQPDVEPAAYFGTPTDIQAAGGQKITGIDLEIRPEAKMRLDSYISAAPLGQRRKDLPDIQLGTVTTLDDPRFTVENGQLGLWQPIEFMFNVGAGFYFLEEFDPDKMPVLFIHGAGGHPGNWRYLVERLDRSKFQPWFFYYPSGLDLDTVATAATRWISTMQQRYEVKRLAIIAHSMGGVVSRAAINSAVAAGGGKRLVLFATLATPWNGHHAAAAGAEHSPVVMPMWRDMKPGSPFLASLFETPLPPQCPYYLLFSYFGSSMFLSEPNDGTVAISSELAWPAQQTAVKVFGFKEDHDGIMINPDVSATLNKLLDDAAR